LADRSPGIRRFSILDYEGQRETVGTVTLDCVPDPRQIQADILANGAPNPVTAAILKYWPTPNIPRADTSDIGCPDGPNAALVTPSLNNLSASLGKIDHTFNPSNVVTGRYFFGDSTQSFPLALTASGGHYPASIPSTPTRVAVGFHFVCAENHRLEQVNEFRVGWNRFAEGFFTQDQSSSSQFHWALCRSTVADCSGSGQHDSGLRSFWFP